MKTAAIILLALLTLSLAGCMTTITTTTTPMRDTQGNLLYDKDGKLLQSVMVVESSNPFKSKGVGFGASGYWLRIVFADPSSGIFLPTIEAVGGDSYFEDAPVASGASVTDTNYEYLYVEKSIWTNNTAVARYIRRSGGLGTKASPAVKIIANINTDGKAMTAADMGVGPLAPVK